MTATTSTTAAPATATLTPARKRLIRRAYRDLGHERAVWWLYGLPSFEGVTRAEIKRWAATLILVPPSRAPRISKPAPPAVTHATVAPADPVTSDPNGTTGEWYSALAIAGGLGIGVERVYAWKLWGWLPGGPLYTAADIRTLFRYHPLEVTHVYLTVEQWLWLVSVLAGSRSPGEGAV